MNIPVSKRLLLGLIPGFLLIFSGFLVGNVLSKIYIKRNIRKNENFLPGKQFRETFFNIDYPITRNIYLFNLTNPDEVFIGGIPEVQEVGPYVFEISYNKENIVDNDKDDTVTFDTRSIWKFNKEKTLPLTGQEMITSYNLILTGGLVRTKRDMPEMIELIMDGINRVTNYPQHPFDTFSAYDLIYEGLWVNCTSPEFSSKAICAALAALGMEKIDSQHYRTSLFKKENGTIYARLKVHRDHKKLNEIVELNDEQELNMYDEPYCNELHGTDGFLYGPLVSKKDVKSIYLIETCRPFHFTYAGKIKVKNKKGMRFVRQSINDNDSKYSCYCRDTDLCPPRGTFDLSICRDGPMLGSNPHFYDADSSFLQNVKGLNPKKELHESYIDFHKLASGPMRSSHKFQISLDLEPVEVHPAMKNLRKGAVPLIWVEVKQVLQNEMWKITVRKVTTQKRVFFTFKIFLILSGVGVIAFVIASELGYIGGNAAISPEKKEINGMAFEYSEKEVNGIE